MAALNTVIIGRQEETAWGRRRVTQAEEGEHGLQRWGECHVRPGFLGRR
jgi:hypothetical protein